MRPSKEEYYLGIADAVSKRSTCLRRQYGAIIVKNDEIIATGYNGSPRGDENCVTLGSCPREDAGVPKGERYELCRAVHAEQNCIIEAARKDMLNATMYIIGHNTDGSLADGTPCLICSKLIRNAGIEEVISIDKNGKVIYLTF